MPKSKVKSKSKRPPKSDTPRSTMQINDIGEDCIRLIIAPLTLKDQIRAGRVCRLWYTVQRSLFLSQKTLVLLVGAESTLDWLSSRKARNNLEDVLGEDGKPLAVDTLKRDWIYGGVKLTRMTNRQIGELHTTFFNITELTIGYGSDSPDPIVLKQIAYLLSRMDQLETLKLSLEMETLREKTGKCLFDAINALPELKYLQLNFQLWYMHEFDLPILRRLNQFDFHCSYVGCIMGGSSILTLWAPHIESRETPLRINFELKGGIDFPRDNPPPAVAAMVTKLRVFCKQPYLKDFSSFYSNLTQLSLEVRDVQMPNILHALVSLKQLVCLSLKTSFSEQFRRGARPAFVSQLPSVKWLSITEYWLSGTAYSHNDVIAWNIPWTYPNLQVFTLLISSTQCKDCRFSENDESLLRFPKQIYETYFKVMVRQCIGRMMMPLEFRCPNENLRKTEVHFKGTIANESRRNGERMEPTRPIHIMSQIYELVRQGYK